MENYNCISHLGTTANRVFDTLTNEIPHWWTEMFTGHSNKEGDLFTIRFGDSIYKTMRVKELIHQSKVVWYVEDSLIAIPGLKKQTEWIGTSITWDIVEKEDHTEVHLTHIGLLPTIECYDICSDGWRQFIASLKQYLETGKGSPFIYAD